MLQPTVSAAAYLSAVIMSAATYLVTGGRLATVSAARRRGNGRGAVGRSRSSRPSLTAALAALAAAHHRRSRRATQPEVAGVARRAAAHTPLAG